MISGFTVWDIAIVVGYLAIVFGIGLLLSKRASRSTEEFFVSGRRLPWWIIGTSMVATTFAADTPLVVSGLVAQGGIYKNWLWWQYGIGGVVAVFLFVRLWKRAGITTDAELIELRYDGKSAAALRAYRATWFGLFQNVLVIAWVMKAMAKIVMVVMGWDETVSVLGMDAEVFIVLGLFFIAVAYTALSGLWGVVITDVLQFVLAMGASIYLAAAALQRIGGMNGLREGILAGGFDLDEVLRMIPRVASLAEANPFTEFLILIGIVWWASYSIDGGGYLAQRLFAAKNERHSVLGFLWYGIAHICLRPWPWIVVGLCGIAMFGSVDDPEHYYPMVMRSILPPGIFGIAVASFFAAFMSTIDTQLNWGSSLIVNDLYRRFFRKGKTEGEYILAARLSVLLLAVLGALGSFAVHDISFAWKLILAVTAGIGTVYMARWYWWRVNAWSEITAMATALVCTLVFTALERVPRLADASFIRFPYSTLITVIVSVPIWVAITFVTRPVGRDHLIRFYERVRPGGLGWRRIAGDLPGFEDDGPGSATLFKILTGLAFLNAVLLGIGNLVLQEFLPGVILAAIAAVSGFVLFRMMRLGKR
jgi:SSS family solute:Na+ symporter